MKKTIILGIAALVAGCFTVNTASAQIQWTPEQKAVWKTETDIWGELLHGQFPGQYLDDSYVEWLTSSPVPIPKADKKRRNAFRASQGNKIIFIDFIPLVIWVKGNFAYADYYQTTIFQDKDGKKHGGDSRWMDVLMKKNGKWVIVGEMGGAEPKPAGE